MATGDIKTFDISYTGLKLTVNAVDLGNGTVKFFITCTEGYADLNALYWGDNVNDGSQFDLGTKKDNSLNMNGTGVDFDGGMKLSDTGLGTAGVNKSTFISANGGPGGTNETLDFTGTLSWDDLDVFGVRATSTSTSGGSIKGTDTSTVATTVPCVTIDDVTVTEGVNANATFTVTLDHPYLYDVIISYTTANSSALSGSDYGATSGTITIKAGETTGTISVPILDDLVHENTEQFFVNITGMKADLPGLGPDLALPIDHEDCDLQGVGTILDNDPNNVPDPNPTPNDFPVWAQDISHIVLYFEQTAGDVKPKGGGDGYYTVGIDNWPGPATNDVDDNIQAIMTWLKAHDSNITDNSDLLGVLIKGGIQPTAFYAYGDHNSNGTAPDAIPAGAPQIVYPPTQGNSDGPSIDINYEYSSVFA